MTDFAKGSVDAPCWIEVDLGAVAANVRVIQSVAQPRNGVTAVVKADAYGLGAPEVARAALGAGAVGLAVARVSEAARLRQAGIQDPILLLGAFTAPETQAVLDLALTATLTDAATAQRLNDAALAAHRTLGVQVKVDTGMARFGAPPEEALALARWVARASALRLDGFYTHFAAADDPDPFFAHQQLARYLSLCRQLENEGVKLGARHVANSAGALRVPGSALDTVRIGIALSGSHATGWVPRAHPLRPAVALKARVVRLHQPAIGSSIGYGRTYKVYRPIRAALISCGYADGLPRSCSNRGRVLIRGRRAPLIGSISMDSAMADVSDLADVQPGDEAVVLGQQGSETITVEELAESAGIIPHELLVRLGSRVPRVYLPPSAST